MQGATEYLFPEWQDLTIDSDRTPLNKMEILNTIFKYLA